MDSMKDIFVSLLGKTKDLGDWKEITYYNENFAKIAVEKGEKIYTFSIRCEKKTDGNI